MNQLEKFPCCKVAFPFLLWVSFQHSGPRPGQDSRWFLVLCPGPCEGEIHPPKSYLWAFPAPLRGCQCSAPALGPASQPLFFNKRGAANPSINFSLNVRMAQGNTKFKYYDFCNSGLLFQSLSWLLAFTGSNGSTFINIALENKSVWFNLPSHTRWKLHYTEQESSWEMLSLGRRFPWELM